MMGKSEARAELERLRQAMEVVGFFAGAQKNIFKLISAILLLGNITFKVVSPTTGTSSTSAYNLFLVTHFLSLYVLLTE